MTAVPATPTTGATTRAATLATAAARSVNRLSDRYRADVRTLGAIRILYALWVLLLPTDYLWIGQVPAAFFQPRTGPAMLLTGPPPSGVLLALQVAQAVLAVALGVGYRTPLVSVLMSVQLVLGSALVYSYGKVDHFVLFELAPLALAAAGWGGAYSVDALRRARSSGSAGPAGSSGFPLLLWGMTVGFGLLSAALPKALTGWADPHRQATRGYLAREVADPVRVGAVGRWIFQFDSALLWKAVDYGTLLAEGGLLLALLYPPLFRLWLVAVTGFHVGVYLTMGISFAPYLFVYLPFFAPWIEWVARRVAPAGVRGIGVPRPRPAREPVPDPTPDPTPDTVVPGPR